jgi:glycosyltransferase involved in cell wall biosynthesis
MVSLVVPVYNERLSLEELHREILETAERHALDLEIIFVDDGSVDGSWEAIRTLAQKDWRVCGLRLRRNFGKAAALAAGFRSARGSTIVTMDADLQDDPSELPRLIGALDQGNDLVSGWKRERRDPWRRRLASRVFNAVVSWTTGVRLHDHNCGFKAYRDDVVREIRLYGELHRFVPALAHARGFRIAEVAVNHRPRRFGSSKYGARRLAPGLLDLASVTFTTGFGGRPQHLLGSLGLIALLFGLAGLVYLAVLWFMRLSDPSITPLHQRPLLIYSAAALIMGAQFLSLGLLAELATAYLRRDSDTYSIAEHVGERAASSLGVPPQRTTSGQSQ